MLNTIIGPNIIKAGWHENDSIQRYQALAVIGGKQISGPMLVITGGADPLIYPQTVEEGVAGSVITFPHSQMEYHLLPNVTHVTAMYAGMKIYMDWIADRFAHKPAEIGYHKHVAKPTRSEAAQQQEANWLIQIKTEPWQRT